jgi:hypothetical protein
MIIHKLIPAAFALGALTLTMPALAAHDAPVRGEAKLAKILAGRTAGQPIRCLDTTQRRNMEVVDRTAMVFKDGDTYYVNRPAGVRFLTWSDVPVFRVWGSQVCSKDLVHLRDTATWMQGATMVMGEFVPYRRNG